MDKDSRSVGSQEGRPGTEPTEQDLGESGETEIEADPSLSELSEAYVQVDQ